MIVLVSGALIAWKHLAPTCKCHLLEFERMLVPSTLA